MILLLFACRLSSSSRVPLAQMYPALAEPPPAPSARPVRAFFRLPATLHIHRQSAYLVGREKRVADIVVDHPSCSKQHAVVQFRLFEKVDEKSGTTRRSVRWVGRGRMGRVDGVRWARLGWNGTGREGRLGRRETGGVGFACVPPPAPKRSENLPHTPRNSQTD